MSKIETYKAGQFSWVDLSARDMSEAKKFYAGLMGWTADDQDTQGGPPYAMFKKDEHEVAGLGQLDEQMQAAGIPPTWNSYVTVEDAAQTAQQVGELGGKVIVAPIPAGDAGTMAFLQDPTGGIFAVWQPGTHRGAALVNEAGCFSWNELATRDPARAQEFYAKLFGWEFERDDSGPGEYYVIKNEGRMNGGLLKMGPQHGEAPPHWMVYLSVDDTDAAAKRIGELGGSIIMPPFDIPPGRMAVAVDAQGAVFSVIKLANPE